MIDSLQLIKILLRSRKRGNVNMTFQWMGKDVCRNELLHLNNFPITHLFVFIRNEFKT